jgi:hypothetical protein
VNIYFCYEPKVYQAQALQVLCANLQHETSLLGSGSGC